MCDDRGMNGTDQTTYFVTCRASKEWRTAMVPVSSGHHSDHEQVADALSHLQICHEREYRAILDEFPTAADLQWSGAHFDVEAMGVDVEWVDWLVMAIEDSQRIVWEDGEPYCTECG